MVKLSVLYPRQEGATFDMQYYREKHLPLCRRLLGNAIKGLAVDEGIASALPSPFFVMFHLTFDSAESMQAAIDAHAHALMADIPNYTNVQPVMQVSRIVEA